MSEQRLDRLLAVSVLGAGLLLSLVTRGAFAQQQVTRCENLPEKAPTTLLNPLNQMEVARSLQREYRRLPERQRLATVVIPLWLRIDPRSGAVLCVARGGGPEVPALDSLALAAAMRLRFARQAKARPEAEWILFPVKFLPPSKTPLRPGNSGGRR